MNDFDSHLGICDSSLSPDSKETWSNLVKALASSMVKLNSAFQAFRRADAIAQGIERRCLPSDDFGDQVARGLMRVSGDAPMGGYGLQGCLFAMVSALRLMKNSRLKTENTRKRDTLAIALWSALAYQVPLAEWRLELLRRDIMCVARDNTLNMAERERKQKFAYTGSSGKSTGPTPQSTARTIEELRRNAVLHEEEISLLRWILADESILLGRSYANVKHRESSALACGLEVGRLVRRFPTFGHLRLATRGVADDTPTTNLFQLMDALESDREPLGKPYGASQIVRDCPKVFPLLSALGGHVIAGEGATERWSLSDWCGRALLESAAVEFVSRGWGEA